MAFDKAKLLAALDEFENAMREVDTIRVHARSRLKNIAKFLNGTAREIERAHDTHEPPPGFFASDPVGDLIGELETEIPAVDVDDLLGLCDRESWNDHLGAASNREKIARWRKLLK